MPSAVGCETCVCTGRHSPLSETWYHVTESPAEEKE